MPKNRKTASRCVARWVTGAKYVLFPTTTVSVLLSLGLITACSADASAPNEQRISSQNSALFQTDSSSYHLVVTPSEFRVTIATSFRNTTDAPVYLWPCSGMSAMNHLEKRIGDAWQVAWRAGCVDIYRPPIKVSAGATYRDTAYVFAMRAPNSDPQFTVDTIPGTYRAVYSVSLLPDPDATGIAREPAPDSLRTSNEFTIEQ